ncbi:hypothetical protein O1611_g1061 [Lasiodiplodia mahajangana]|uniref:Uncharacterized protein n=1 Tax=Lasiodiplodia mahajangana TaxID=1108764 RepID=A0ACC2JYX6_9PEZI|nr:hypothetical protein O1611_g1061 [Lasiodiplodia mahajangana]
MSSKAYELTGQANVDAHSMDFLDISAFLLDNTGSNIMGDQVEQDPWQGEREPLNQQFLPTGNFLGAIPPAPVVGGDTVYAVGVMASSRVEPLLAIFNWQAEYSCILATVAETLGSGVQIRQTTPSQRNRSFLTPAGCLDSPQRYGEFNVTAFDPRIPTVKVNMLLLEGAAPMNGVHVYLGNGLRTKLERMGVQLRVRESSNIAGQTIESGSTGVPGPGTVEHAGDTTCSGNIPTSGEMFPTLTPFQVDINQYLYEYSESSQANTAESTLFSELYTHGSSAVSSYSGLEPLLEMIEGAEEPTDSIVCGFTTCQSGYDQTFEWNLALNGNQHSLDEFLNWE